MSNFRDVEWKLPTDSKGTIAHWDALTVAVLMDIREELRTLA